MNPDELRQRLLQELDRVLETAQQSLSQTMRPHFADYRTILAALTNVTDFRGESGYPAPHSLSYHLGEWVSLLATGGLGKPRL